MSAANVAFVQSQYVAFQRGDIDSILASCAPDIRWQVKGRTADYPMIGVWHGPEGVRDFFRQLAEMQEPVAFEPREFHAAGDLIFVLGRYVWTIRKTGRQADAEWVHVFCIAGGMVAAFDEFTDSAQFAAAWRG